MVATLAPYTCTTCRFAFDMIGPGPHAGLCPRCGMCANPDTPRPEPKPLAARITEARGRARTNELRVFVVTPGHHYRTRSVSNPNDWHDLINTRTGWTCQDCKGFAFTGMCHHLGALARRLEREGHGIGRIARPLAPLATAAD